MQTTATPATTPPETRLAALLRQRVHIENYAARNTRQHELEQIDREIARVRQQQAQDEVRA